MSIDPQTGLPVQQPPRSGGCFRSCLTMGCLGSIAIAVCCGVGTVMIRNSIQFEQNAQIATLIGQEAGADELLAGFTGKGSVKIDIPFVGPFVKVAFYEGQGDGALVLGEFNGSLMPGDALETFETQFQAELDKQTGRDNFRRVNQKTRELTVRGQKVSFDFTVGEKIKDDHGHGGEGEKSQPGTGKKAWIVSGSYQGKNGPAFLLLILPHESITEDEIARKIESIK